MVSKNTKTKGPIPSGGARVPAAGELEGERCGGGAARGSSERAREAADGALHLYTMEYYNNGEVHWAQFTSKMKAVHLMYFDYPSIFYMATLSSAAYLTESHANDSSEPEICQHSRNYLERRLG